MKYLMVSLIATLCAYVLNIFVKQKPKPIYYVFIFIIAFLSGYFGKKLNAHEFFDETPFQWGSIFRFQCSKRDKLLNSLYFMSS